MVFSRGIALALALAAGAACSSGALGSSPSADAASDALGADRAVGSAEGGSAVDASVVDSSPGESSADSSFDGAWADAPARCQGPLTFADPGLDALVHHLVDAGPGPITPAQAATILAITISDDGGSLDGIECLVNLRTVLAINIGLTDIGALSGLSALEEVEIQNNQVSDLTPLTDHPNLRQILAGNNRISSLAGVRLTTLDASACAVLDLIGNPIAPEQFAAPCAQGWFAEWGDPPQIEAGSCGSSAPCVAQSNK